MEVTIYIQVMENKNKPIRKGGHHVLNMMTSFSDGFIFVFHYLNIDGDFHVDSADCLTCDVAATTSVLSRRRPLRAKICTATITICIPDRTKSTSIPSS